MSIFPTKILLATDGSEEAELAALRAVDLAQSTDSELHVVHIGLVPSFLMSDPGALGYNRKLYEELYEEIEEESRELLRKLSWQVKVAGGTVAETHLRMGQVDLEIVALAKEVGAGLIVMGCRGHRGIRRAIEGSISDGVIRHAPARCWWCARTRGRKPPSGLPSCKEEVDKRPEGGWSGEVSVRGVSRTPQGEVRRISLPRTWLSRALDTITQNHVIFGA